MTYWWSSGTWAKVINLTQTFLSAVTPIKYVHGYGVLCLVVITPVLCWFFWSAKSRVVMIRIYWHQRYRRFTLWASSAVAIDDLVFMITTPWWLDNTKIKRHMRHGVSNHWQLDRSSSWLYSLATRKIIKAPLFWLFVRETTVDQWVSLTKGHWFGKRFHVRCHIWKRSSLDKPINILKTIDVYSVVWLLVCWR